jgi:preprotein translocase subunit SecD
VRGEQRWVQVLGTESLAIKRTRCCSERASRALLFLGALLAAALAANGCVRAGDDEANSNAKSAATVLVYELDTSGAEAEVPDATMKKVVRAVDRRVNPGWFRRVTVRQAGGKRIEVVVPSTGPVAVQKIQRLVEAIGTLEFRILATMARPQYQTFIERAKKLPDGESQLKDDKGKPLARWVPVMTGREKTFREIPDIATRTVERRGTKQFEVLVVIDPYNVNGTYLTKARVGESSGRACVELAFNDVGAELFGQLTGSHLPDATRKSRYHLGIVLDGYLHSAPYIKTAISANAQISGVTIEEAQETVHILNAGGLPAALRRVQPPARPEPVSPEGEKPRAKT